MLSTIAQIGDLVSQIGGDRIESQVLVQRELNPHIYELVKGDDEKISSAAVIFYNGLGLEHGASVVAMIGAHPNAIALGDAIVTKLPQEILYKEGQVDPHIWMDISLWKETVDPITEALSQIDPLGTSYFEERAFTLKENMDRKHCELVMRLQSIPENKRYLVTSHDAFHYFTRRYLAEPSEKDWGKRFAAPEGLAPDGQLNPVDLQKIVEHLKMHHIETLFPESNVSRDSIRKIADAGKKLGLNVRLCLDALYGDAMQGTYLEAMDHNAEVIVRHLKGES